MLTRQLVHDMYGEEVHDPDEQAIGALSGVYEDSETKEARFIAVRTGLLGAGETIVPVKKDDVIQGVIRVAYSKDVIKSAPEVETSDQLPQEVEERVVAYYERHERREPEPLPPPGDILEQREATKDIDPENPGFDIPDKPAEQTL